MRRTILNFSLAGTLLFGIAFVLSWLHPIWIERAAGAALRIEVERQTGERLDALSGSAILGHAQRVLGRTEADIERTREAIRREVPDKVARVVAAMRDPDCACRQRLVTGKDVGALQDLASLTQLRTRLSGLIESAYADVRLKLLREVRIFTGSNAAAMALLGIVTLLRRRAGLQLMLPAAALAGGVLVTAGLYLFGQDWLHTIVFDAYVGLAYIGWLVVVVLLLADILGNRARVTSWLVNACLQAAAALVKAVPC